MKQSWYRLGCGLDVSKKQFYACIGGIKQDGFFVVRASRKFDNNSSGVEQFLEWLDTKLSKLNPQSSVPFQIIVEPTGVYHETLLAKCYEADLPICQVVGQRVKHYLHSIDHISKTDRDDAKGICRMACEQKHQQWKPCSPNIMRIRTALRHRRSLVDSKTRFANQLHALNNSKWSSRLEEESLQRLIDEVDKEIKRTEQLITELYQQDEVLKNRLQKIIDSVYGLGLLTALTPVAETNGFASIRSRKQLARYAGYDIIQDQSGQRRGRTRISKRGNARIRAQMHMASLSVVKKKGPLQALFLRVLSRNPNAKMKAYVAVQRKLLLLIYTLYKKDQAYDPNYHKRLYGHAQKQSSPHQLAGYAG